MKLTITTNHHWHDFLYREDVPEKILADQFDWTNEAYEKDGDYSTGFICYRGHYYHLSEFLLTSGELADLGWHGYAADGFSSGTLLKVSADSELYQIASYRC